MKLELPLPLRLPADDAWAALSDAGRLAPALPGATVVESDEASARGTLSVDLGWTSVAYRGAIRVEEADAQARSVSLRGLGQGEAGEGLAELKAAVVVREDGAEASVADVSLEVAADGDVGGLMSETPETLAQRLGAAFADLLAGGPAAAADEPEPASTVSESQEVAVAAHDDAAGPLVVEADESPIAPEIPLPQRPSLMEEVAMVEAMHDGDDGAEAPVDLAPAPVEPAPVKPAPAPVEPAPATEPGVVPRAEPGQAEDDLPREPSLAEETVDAVEDDPAPAAIAPDIPEPQRMSALEELAINDAASDVPPDLPEPEIAPLAPELPKAPRTGSIPPPGWSPAGPTGGAAGRAKPRGKVRLPRGGKPKSTSEGTVTDVPAAPSEPSAQGGLPGLVAKVRGALKR